MAQLERIVELAFRFGNPEYNDLEKGLRMATVHYANALANWEERSKRKNAIRMAELVLDITFIA